MVDTFSSHASLLRAIDGVVSLALRARVVSQAPQHLRFFPRRMLLVMVALPAVWPDHGNPSTTAMQDSLLPPVFSPAVVGSVTCSGQICETLVIQNCL